MSAQEKAMVFALVAKSSMNKRHEHNQKLRELDKGNSTD